MLVLTRTRGERIIIDGGWITIQVLGINDGQVKIGITAPAEVSIHREEVQDAIERRGGGGR